MTRRQKLMAQALKRVQSILSESDDTLRGAYGGLCHKLPVLIRRNGLCQTVAFVESKAGTGSPQQRAYGLICEHFAEALGQKRGELVSAVAGAPLEEYMRLTRTALMAWEFHKRFAVSILGVESGDVEADGS